MPVSAFNSFQAYDEVLAFGIQSAYGSAGTANRYVMANYFALNFMNDEISTYGTSASRGLRADQRIKSGRMATFQFSVNLGDNTDIRALLEWAFGASTGVTNALKLATLACRKTGGVGYTVQDCAVRQADILFRQGQVITLVVDGIVLADWTTGTPVAADVPSALTPLIIEDTTFTIQGTELPVSDGMLSLAQGINPVFANNAYPVSFELVGHRALTFSTEIPAYSASFDLIQDYRDDSVGDITIATSDITFALQDCVFLGASGADYTGQGVGPVSASFRATKPDSDTAEMSISYG